MTRIIIVCEGKTERDFVGKIVSPYLSGLGIYVSNPILGKPGKKGGDVKKDRIVGDIVTHLKNDRNAYCTTFLDFYGMKSDVPGRIEAAEKNNHEEKKQIVEEAIFRAIEEKVEDGSITRFKPYVQMYELEALLFSNVEKMSSRLSDGDSKNEQKIQNEFKKILETKSPEEINDGKETAPSKRIEKMISGYSKTKDGIPLAEDIGLKEIRAKCPLFNGWIVWMEKLGVKK